MTRKRSFISSPLLGTLALALIWVTVAATPTEAAVSAGTVISNVASVDYAEGAQVTSLPATTTINLVSGLAWIDNTLSLATQTVAGATAITNYTVDLLNTGTGFTTAVVTDGTSQLGGLTAGSWLIDGGATASVPLGATLSTGAGVLNGGNTDIPVSNALVSGLAIGDKVRIGGINGPEFTVNNIVDGTLTLTGDATVSVNAAGIQIGELATVTFSGTTGTPTATGQFHDHSMTASDEDSGVGAGLNSDGNASASDDLVSDGTTDWETYVSAGVLSIDKYVRNDTTPVIGATPIAYAGENYYKTGVKGDAGTDTLEYLIVVTNAGPGNATAVVVTDTISSYLTLDNTTVDIDSNGDGTFDIVDAVAGAQDAATFVGSLLTAYPGTGGVASTTTGGTILAPVGPATGVVTAVRFQADINP